MQNSYVLQGESWTTPSGAQGLMDVAKYTAWISHHQQGKHPPLCTIVPPPLDLFIVKSRFYLEAPSARHRSHHDP